MKKKKLTAYGKAIKLRLCEQEMLQAELAELLGCSRQYLARILVGDRSGKKYSKRIEEILGVIYIEEDSISTEDECFQ